MKTTRLLIFLLVLSLSLAYLSIAPRAQAVSLSPLTFELAANPGETIINVLKVTNTDDAPVNVAIEVEDFSAVGEEGRVALESPSKDLTYSLARWVTVSPSALTILANDSATIQFTINIPIDAEPGGHYGSVLASISAAPSGGGVAVVQKVGSLILISVAGEVEEIVRIAEFSVPNFSQYGPVTILSRFENTGTIHVKPRGFILIENIFGKEIAQLDLPQKNVLPRSIRRIEVPWGDRFMFGKYEATLTAIYGSTNEPLSAITTFWIIPWKIAGAVLLGVIILLSILIKGRKRFRLALRILFRGSTFF